MWVFTQSGFVSAVRHYDQPAIVVVRARDRESLQDLAASIDAPIEKSPSNDYPYRVHVVRAASHHASQCITCSSGRRAAGLKSVPFV